MPSLTEVQTETAVWLPEFVAKARQLALKGTVNNFIPALSRVDPAKLGFSLLSLDGTSVHFGGCNEKLSIQSISKLYAMHILVNKDSDGLWARVGQTPSATYRFDTISQLEQDAGIPRYPFLNSGALVMTDMLCDITDDPTSLILEHLETALGLPGLQIDRDVAISEYETADRNRALGYYLKSHRNLKHSVEKVVRAYCEMCAITMSCQELATAAFAFANNGCDLHGRQIIAPAEVRKINMVTQLCGLYGDSLSFSTPLNLAAKSGSGGGIVAALPGRFSIAAWSPPLTETGNSVAAMHLLQQSCGVVS